MSQVKAETVSGFNFRLRWIVTGLLLAGAVWVVFKLEVPGAGGAVTVYCTPELSGPLDGCMEEFTLREGYDVIIVSQPAPILFSHIIRTRDGDVIFALDQDFFKRLKEKKIITEDVDTGLTCPDGLDGTEQSSIPSVVRGAVIRGSRFPETAKSLISFLSRPECIGMFRYASGKEMHRRKR